MNRFNLKVLFTDGTWMEYDNAIGIVSRGSRFKVICVTDNPRNSRYFDEYNWESVKAYVRGDA